MEICSVVFCVICLRSDFDIDLIRRLTLQRCINFSLFNVLLGFFFLLITL